MTLQARWEGSQKNLLFGITSGAIHLILCTFTMAIIMARLNDGDRGWSIVDGHGPSKGHAPPPCTGGHHVRLAIAAGAKEVAKGAAHEDAKEEKKDASYICLGPIQKGQGADAHCKASHEEKEKAQIAPILGGCTTSNHWDVIGWSIVSSIGMRLVTSAWMWRALRGLLGRKRWRHALRGRSGRRRRWRHAL
jgi:hypothetical protein